MLDDLCNPEVMETFWMIGAQLGKTECLNSAVGYFIHQSPAPILVVYPTLDSARKWSQKKLSPMLRDTPCLQGRVKDPRSRDSGNTILDKTFPGGDLTAVGANSPAGLRQLSKKIVLQDEIDTYEATSEGDPCELADARAETFHDAVFLKCSTPTLKGQSRVEAGFEKSDQQYWFVPCHECGQHQRLKWGQVKWEDENIADAWYQCEHCNARWSDQDRIRNIRAGEWRATAPFKGVRGRHLSGLYRLIGKKKAFRSYLHEFVSSFLRAKNKGRHGLMVWINTFLAETWEEETERVSANALVNRREAYPGNEIPSGVLAVTCGADLQMDRIEYEIVGWGQGFESWGIEYGQVTGSPLMPATWAAFAERIERKFAIAGGRQSRVHRVFIDSGGQKGFDEAVYRFAKPRSANGVFAIRGSNTKGAVAVPATPSRNNKLRAPVFRLGVDELKRQLLSMLKVDEPGPGFMHWPEDDTAGFDENYFSMLTSEELRVKVVKGFRVTEWHQTRARNEAWDCRVYNLGAVVHLNPNWAKLKKLAEKVQQDDGQGGDAQQTRTDDVDSPRRVRPLRTSGRATWATKI